MTREGKVHFQPEFDQEETRLFGTLKMTGFLFQSFNIAPSVQCPSAMVFWLHLRSVQCTPPLKGGRVLLHWIRARSRSCSAEYVPRKWKRKSLGTSGIKYFPNNRKDTLSKNIGAAGLAEQAAPKKIPSRRGRKPHFKPVAFILMQHRPPAPPLHRGIKNATERLLGGKDLTLRTES
jgi:hypothetical protein